MDGKPKIILAGAGGCMRELICQMQDSFEITGYVDCKKPKGGIGVTVGKQQIKYLGDDDFLLAKTEDTEVIITVGEPALRKKIALKLKRNPHLKFPNIILGNTLVCDDIIMGEGCIISMDCRISTNVKLGDFVFLNTGSKICHDGRIGDFVTLAPDATLAGAVTVGDESEIGLGAKVIQCITIGAHTVVGAGAVVIRDIEGCCTVAGVPAKIIKGEE